MSTQTTAAPETEANEFAIFRQGGPTEAGAVDSNFARRLEIERNSARSEATEMRKQRDLACRQVLILTAENNRLRKGITEIKAGTRIGWFMTDLGAKCARLLNK